MRRVVAPLLVSLALAGCTSPQRQPAKPPAAAPASPVGVWSQKVPPWDDTSPTIRLAAEPFVYDGMFVTIRLWTMHAWMWRAPDDVYRVETRWKSDMLQWHPPFGTWSDLARFEDGRFVDADGLPFERIAANELSQAHRALLAPHEPHDYAITALGLGGRRAD